MDFWTGIPPRTGCFRLQYQSGGRGTDRCAAKSRRVEVSGYVYPDKELVPDETALGRLLIALPPKTELLVAVGTGTIGDLCRFAGYKIGVPFVTVATAPSMDGFSSNVAPLITNHLKTTYEARVPLAVFGDLDFCRNRRCP